MIYSKYSKKNLYSKPIFFQIVLARDGLENVYDNNFMWGCYQKLAVNENKNSGMILSWLIFPTKMCIKSAPYLHQRIQNLSKLAFLHHCRKLVQKRCHTKNLSPWQLAILAILIEQKGVTRNLDFCYSFSFSSSLFF